MYQVYNISPQKLMIFLVINNYFGQKFYWHSICNLVDVFSFAKLSIQAKASYGKGVDEILVKQDPSLPLFVASV